jgi:hypothetical protein
MMNSGTGGAREAGVELGPISDSTAVSIPTSSTTDPHNPARTTSGASSTASDDSIDQHENLNRYQFFKLFGYVLANSAMLDFNITHLESRIRELYGVEVTLGTLRAIFVTARALNSFCSRRGTVLKASAPTDAEIKEAYKLYKYLVRQDSHESVQLPDGLRKAYKRIESAYKQKFNVDFSNDAPGPDLGELSSSEQKIDNVACYILFSFDYLPYFYNACVATYLFSSQLIHMLFSSLSSSMSAERYNHMMKVMFEDNWDTAIDGLKRFVQAKLVLADLIILPLTLCCAYLIASTYKRYKLNCDARLNYLRLAGGHVSLKEMMTALIFGLALAGGTAFASNFTSFKALDVGEKAFPLIGELSIGGMAGWLPWLTLLSVFPNTLMYSMPSSLRNIDRVKNIFTACCAPRTTFKALFAKTDHRPTEVEAETPLSCSSAMKNRLVDSLSFVAILSGLIDMAVGKQLIIAPLTFFDFIYGASHHHTEVPLPPLAENWQAPKNAAMYSVAIYLVFFGLFPKLDYNLYKLADGLNGHLTQFGGMAKRTGSKLASCASLFSSSKSSAPEMQPLAGGSDLEANYGGTITQGGGSEPAEAKSRCSSCCSTLYYNAVSCLPYSIRSHFLPLGVQAAQSTGYSSI